MSKLVLVHGGFHGAWAWQALLPELSRLGHRGVAPDLPIEEIGAGPDQYAEAVCRAIAGDGTEDVILVGHSVAGTVLPRVAWRVRIRGLIYLCPGLPPRNEAEHAQNLDAFDPGLGAVLKVDAEGMATMAPADAIRVFYHDAPAERANWAAGRLRPQWIGGLSTVYAPIAGFPDVPARAIVGTNDRVLRHDRIRHLIKERLGVEPIDFPGGHSPFLSRPAELAARLDELVQSIVQATSE